MTEGYSGNAPCTPSYSLCHMIYFYKIWYFYISIPDHFTLIIKCYTPSQGKWSMLYILPWQFECIINPSPSLMKFNITWSPSLFVIFYLALSVNFISTFSINTYCLCKVISELHTTTILSYFVCQYFVFLLPNGWF